MARILVTSPVPGGLDPLGAHEIDQRQGLTHRELVEAVRGVDGLVCLLTDRVDAEVLSSGDRLRVVGNVAVGFDNIDVETATRRGIVVCNTPDVLDDTTADLAFALILAARRRLSGAERDLRRGAWEGWSIDGYLGRDVHGATLGIVGYGRIGRAVARRATGFDMEVLHHCRTPTGEPGYVPQLRTLLGRVDIVSLHVPLTPETHHLIGPDELSVMRPSAVLVNTARGPVVDEAALVDALESGTIFGAGLDVYEDEPDVHPGLLERDDVVLLPHVGSATIDTRRRMVEVAAEGVRQVLAGSLPDNAVNPDAHLRP